MRLALFPAAVSAWFVKVIPEVLARLWSFASRMQHIIAENGISLIQKRQVKNREAADLQKRTSVPALLNALVGGSPASDHMTGCAADIQGTPRTPEENRKLFTLIQELKLPFDQLIDEKGMSWVHVSHRAKGNRGQVLKMK